jgi:hypothetical protein
VCRRGAGGFAVDERGRKMLEMYDMAPVCRASFGELQYLSATNYFIRMSAKTIPTTDWVTTVLQL